MKAKDIRVGETYAATADPSESATSRRTVLLPFRVMGPQMPGLWWPGILTRTGQSTHRRSMSIRCTWEEHEQEAQLRVEAEKRHREREQAERAEHQAEVGEICRLLGVDERNLFPWPPDHVGDWTRINRPLLLERLRWLVAKEGD